jgi:hypothetical protein
MATSGRAGTVHAASSSTSALNWARSASYATPWAQDGSLESHPHTAGFQLRGNVGELRDHRLDRQQRKLPDRQSKTRAGELGQRDPRFLAARGRGVLYSASIVRRDEFAGSIGDREWAFPAASNARTQAHRVAGTRRYRQSVFAPVFALASWRERAAKSLWREATQFLLATSTEPGLELAMGVLVATRCFAQRFLWIVERHFCELRLANV